MGASLCVARRVMISFLFWAAGLTPFCQSLGNIPCECRICKCEPGIYSSEPASGMAAKYLHLSHLNFRDYSLFPGLSTFSLYCSAHIEHHPSHGGHFWERQHGLVDWNMGWESFPSSAIGSLLLWMSHCTFLCLSFPLYKMT